MSLSDNENDLVRAAIGAVKSTASLVPVLGQIIAGHDSYQRSRHDRNVAKILEHLKNKIDDIDALFKRDWTQTDDGELFVRKVIDSALDSQLEDKQELFMNALIHGIEKTDIDQLERLKFVDMLRHLSRASLMVLSEMDGMFLQQVRGPGRSPDPISAFPQVNAEAIALKLTEKNYDPYLVTASVDELESQGLFSRTGEWIKGASGKYTQGGGFATELCYTDFAARFVEFISSPPTKVK